MAELSGWDIAVLLAKTVAYASTLGAAGSIFFLGYSGALLQGLQCVRIRRSIWILMLISAFASLGTIPLLTGSMSGELSGMYDRESVGMIMRVGDGRATGIRIAGLALALFAISQNRRLQVIGILGAAIAATSFAWVGHIHALLPNALPTALLCLHLLCAAFWLGALAPLLIVARDGHPSQTARIAARFGKCAMGVVVLLIIAGSALLWILIHDAAVFWSSGYGRMFALKLFGVAFLLSAAALNKLYLAPRLLLGDTQAARLLRGSIKIEMVLGGLILLITATFTTVAGPP
jgi:putative copper resistance protein D